MFILKLFIGSILDRCIVEESGYLEKFEFGDDVIVDRGFLIRDLFVKWLVILNILFYFMGK